VTGSLIPPATAGVMAEAIAAAAINVPGVARLAGGKFGQIATYAPGRKVNGVRFTGNAVEVHLVAEWVESLPQLADDVRAALDTLTAGRSVSVFVDDITQIEISASPEDDVVAERVEASSDATATSETDADRGRLTWAKTLI
jgi:hypothetical protein